MKCAMCLEESEGEVLLIGLNNEVEEGELLVVGHRL